MKTIFFLLLGLLPLVNFSYGQSMENIQTTILDKDSNSATVQISWTHHDNVKLYKVGCVSCQPNIEQVTDTNNIILHNVTPFPNGDIMLYILLIDNNDEIITGKQLIIPFN